MVTVSPTASVSFHVSELPATFGDALPTPAVTSPLYTASSNTADRSSAIVASTGTGPVFITSTLYVTTSPGSTVPSIAGSGSADFLTEYDGMYRVEWQSGSLSGSMHVPPVTAFTRSPSVGVEVSA